VNSDILERIIHRIKQAQGIAWRWDQLRRLGESRAVRLTSILPILTFILSYAESLESSVSQTAQLSVNLLSPNVLMFFYGLLCFAVGTLIYVLFVPYQVSKYGDDVEYFNAEKKAWWRSEPDEIIKRFPSDSPHLPEFPRDNTELIRKYYRHLCDINPLARLGVSVFYAFGFLLTTLPIIFRVLRITFYVATS
jgi:hypothetical protein